MIDGERYVQGRFLHSKEKVQQNAFILGTCTNTQEREFAPRGTSLLSHCQAIEQIFFLNIFMVRRGILVHPFHKHQKREHNAVLVTRVVFFMFGVSILGWYFLELVMEE